MTRHVQIRTVVCMTTQTTAEAHTVHTNGIDVHVRAGHGHHLPPSAIEATIELLDRRTAGGA
jgi:hypothetical protein